MHLSRLIVSIRFSLYFIDKLFTILQTVSLIVNQYRGVK